MIYKLIGEGSFPKNVEMSATPLIDGLISVNVWGVQEACKGGVGSERGGLIGRVCLKPTDALKLIAELTEGCREAMR